MSAIQTDFDKDYVLTGDRGQLNSVKIPDLQYTNLGKLIIYRLMHDRDVKILITGAGKTTGTGKTTLALQLAKWVNAVRNELFDVEYEWSAEDYSFMDVWEYLERYKDSKPGDCLITDELKYMTDNRRWMTNQNVKFSQAWSILRYKNVVTIGTAPGLGDLDKRTKETADVWIRVMRRGVAHPYYMTYNDFENEPMNFRMRKGSFKEAITWGDMAGDPDYEWLKEEKEEMGVPGIDDGQERLDKADLRKKEREIRNEATRELVRVNEREGRPFSQKKIAEATGVSQAQVSKLKLEMEDAGELTA